jgi:hypothetical protein
VDIGFVTSTNTAIDASSDWCWWLVVAISKIVSARYVNSINGISVVQCVGGNVMEIAWVSQGICCQSYWECHGPFFFSPPAKIALDDVIPLLHALSTLRYK